MLHDIYNHLTFTQGAVNVMTAPTIAVNYAGVATKDKDTVIVVHLGNSGDTLGASLDVNLEVEHCDDGSTYVDCADADISGAVTGSGASTGAFAHIDAPAEDSAVFTTRYKGIKKYVRCVMHKSGTHSNGIPISVVYVQAAVQGPNALT